jgi:outer membrane receptor protein involved in Fe transport
MRFFRFRTSTLIFAIAIALGLAVLVPQHLAFSQETTGGLQGTVKDPSGAVVPKAQVILTGTTLIGSKELVTDASGYYRFANLPPGGYSIVVKADGFETSKLSGLVIEIGRLPSIDIILKVGATATTVEVTGTAPAIDTTTTQNLTNVSSEQLQNLPTGTSFQSVIQFAPMARDEPLAGYSVNGHGTGGSGGSMPGSSGNGLSLGYSIGGAADSESSYLVEGQDTENISGGYSKANVPMEFIQDVDIKTSGVEAEYGGALGGVVNVILKKGSDAFHGQISATYESSGTDANPVNAYLRYDPTANGSGRFDPDAQIYSPQKYHFRTAEPSVLVGGPIVKEHLWFVAGFEPLISSRAETVNFGSNDNNAGNQYFTQDRQQYFGYGRIDAAITQRIRVFGSWLTQYAREAGDEFPIADPTSSESAFVNTSTQEPLSQFNHGLGWSAPNATYNVGADISLTQRLVATTRYGYFFDNYHDFGWPTQTPDIIWQNNGFGACDNSSTAPSAACPTGGAPLPASIQNYNGSPAFANTSTTPYDSTYTTENADKHYQLNQDFAFYKGGWWGTHNFKFGYQLNHLVNVIDQNGNVPYAFMTFGNGVGHGALTSTGGANCGKLTTEWGTCAGLYGSITVQDFSTILLNSSGAPTPASDWNHAFYVQDSWNIGHGLTFDLGLRIEKETLPAPGGVNVSSIAFPWSDKIEPRLGAAWDPSGHGKMKIYGSYGVVNDVMKLLLAQTSWGAQAYEQCSYPIGPDGTSSNFSVSDINLTFKAGRACPNGPANTQANFTGTGKPPTALTDAKTGVSIIENVNFRPWEPVSPNVKPYRQHEYVAGFEYQISPALAFSARYNRRRLDHVIEDASLSDAVWGETYTIVNPGENVNDTIDDYATYLHSIGMAFGVPGWEFSDTADYGPGAAFGTCPSCPPNPKAIRDYDGLELRLTVAQSHGFSGMFSYTYSSLWGNYTGLTTTDQSDGGVTGRNSPDTTRAFDEPFFYFGASGKSTNGNLPTDRPNVIKGLGYYTLPWKHMTTNIGLVENFLQGTPVGSYIDIGGATTGQDFEGTYPFGRDQWVNTTQDTHGNITLGTPYLRRTPWFTQSDLSMSHEIRVGDHENISIEANALNALNQRAVVAYFEGMDSWLAQTSLSPTNAGCGGPCNIYSGASFYQATETGYNVQSLINTDGVVLNSQYGKPYLYQNGRQLRFGVRYTF